jgi:hypothetical protein
VTEAIESAVRGEQQWLLDRPSKLADLILERVNENLKARGHKGISQRTLSRRLKKEGRLKFDR